MFRNKLGTPDFWSLFWDWLKILFGLLSTERDFSLEILLLTNLVICIEQ